jgi:hypothetical protein
MTEQTEREKELHEQYAGTVIMDQFREALIGFGSHFTASHGHQNVAIYDRDKIIDMLEQEFRESAKDSFPFDGADRDFRLEAEEYFDFNVAGAYAAKDGACMPVFVEKIDTPSWQGFSD